MDSEQEPVREMPLEIVAASALESLERASVDLQISTAHKYPRSPAISKRKMMELATLDEETAESCFYKLNRQGKGIEGPSIRLAEIAASCFGNLRYGSRVVANDGKQITAQGFCHDLESNVMFTIEVRRRITDRNGRTYSDDMQVVTGNAACAIAARNAIFKVVPFAFVKPIFLAAKKTAVGDITTLADRRAKMLAKFAALGVNEKRVCASVEKAGVEEIGLDDLETLIGVYSAVRDGDQSVEEAFPEVKKPPQFGEAGIPEQKVGPLGALIEEKKPVPDVPEKDKQAKSKKDKPAPALATPLEGVRNLMVASHIEEGPLLAHLFSEMVVEQGEVLSGMTDEKLLTIQANWVRIVEAMTKES